MKFSHIKGAALSVGVVVANSVWHLLLRGNYPVPVQGTRIGDTFEVVPAVDYVCVGPAEYAKGCIVTVQFPGKREVRVVFRGHQPGRFSEFGEIDWAVERAIVFENGARISRLEKDQIAAL